MTRRPPRSTRTDTLFPYTTLFRSSLATAWRLVGDGQTRCPALTSARITRAVTCVLPVPGGPWIGRSEEHTSELQSLMRISYAVFCLKKKKYLSHYPSSLS